MVDIHWEGRSQKSALQKRYKAHPTGAPENWGWDHGGNKAHWGALHPGRVYSSSSWLPELLRWERHKVQAEPSLCFCGVTENLNLSGLGLGSALNSGPAPYRAAWSLSSVDRESRHDMSGGKPSVAGTLWVLPTDASDIRLQCPSLPTARLNKWT